MLLRNGWTLHVSMSLSLRWCHKNKEFSLSPSCTYTPSGTLLLWPDLRAARYDILTLFRSKGVVVKFREGELVRGWANLVPTTFFLAKEKALGTSLRLDLLLSEVSLLLGRSSLSGIYQGPQFFYVSFGDPYFRKLTVLSWAYSCCLWKSNAFLISVTICAVLFWNLNWVLSYDLPYWRIDTRQLGIHLWSSVETIVKTCKQKGSIYNVFLAHQYCA